MNDVRSSSVDAQPSNPHRKTEGAPVGTRPGSRPTALRRGASGQCLRLGLAVGLLAVLVACSPLATAAPQTQTPATGPLVFYNWPGDMPQSVLDAFTTETGISVAPGGYVAVDKVSRTSARGVYAAGDCTGVFALASVAAMQGRIAMWHSLGDAVTPLDLRTVSSNVFTAPEIATVGVSQAQVDAGDVKVASVMLPLGSNARAKMQGLQDGFVKLFCLPTTGIIVGGVVVAPHASELIHSISIAVSEKITVDSLAHDFTVYPSLSGSVAEAARRLHLRQDPTASNLTV